MKYINNVDKKEIMQIAKSLGFKIFKGFRSETSVYLDYYRDCVTIETSNQDYSNSKDYETYSLSLGDFEIKKWSFKDNFESKNEQYQDIMKNKFGTEYIVDLQSSQNKDDEMEI